MPLVDPKTGKVYREIHSKNGRVFYVPSSGKIEDITAGVIIDCKNCGKSEVVAEGSLCHSWGLCVACARRRLPSSWRRGR